MQLLELNNTSFFSSEANSSEQVNRPLNFQNLRLRGNFFNQPPNPAPDQAQVHQERHSRNQSQQHLHPGHLNSTHPPMYRFPNVCSAIRWWVEAEPGQHVQRQLHEPILQQYPTTISTAHTTANTAKPTQPAQPTWIAWITWIESSRVPLPTNTPAEQEPPQQAPELQDQSLLA